MPSPSLNKNNSGMLQWLAPHAGDLIFNFKPSKESCRRRENLLMILLPTILQLHLR
jgi:hypothetical protein